MATQQKILPTVRVPILLLLSVLFIFGASTSNATTQTQGSYCMTYAGGTGSLKQDYPGSPNCNNECASPNVCRSGRPSAVSQQVSSAQISVGGAIAWAAVQAFQGIGYAVGFFFGNLSAIFASLIQWAINPTNWGGYTSNSLVTDGQKITLSLANMFLVVALMVIAIATILRLESYGMRKTLLRLIFIAILINFNLVLAGILIDAANILTTFFIAMSSASHLGFDSNYYNQFAGGFGSLMKLILSPPQTAGTLTGAFQNFSFGSLTILAGVLFFVIFTIVMTIVLGALFIMLIIRVAVLWILLILAPLAFVFAIFPGTISYFKEWWKNFLGWNLFAPVMAFFLFLAFSAVGMMAKYNYGATAPSAGTIYGTTFPGLIMQFVVFIALLIIGMMSAKRFGIIGADIGIKLATNAVRLPGKIGKTQATRISQQASAGLEGFGTRLATLTGPAGTVAGLLGIRAAGRAITEQALRARGELQKRQKDRASLFNQMSKENAEAFARDGSAGVGDRISASRRAIDLGVDFTQDSQGQNMIQQLGIAAAQRRFADDFRVLLSQDPRLFVGHVPGINTLEDAMRRLKASESENLGASPLRDPVVLRELFDVKGFAAFNRLAQEASQSKLKIAATTLNTHAPQFQDLIPRLGTQPAWNAAGIPVTPVQLAGQPQPQPQPQQPQPQQPQPPHTPPPSISTIPPLPPGQWPPRPPNIPPSWQYYQPAIGGGYWAP